MRDQAITARFVEELRAKGILNLKEASAKAVWRSGKRAGKRVSSTWISQLICRGRGTLEVLEMVCAANGLDWQFVRYGRRGNGAAAPEMPASPHGIHGLNLLALLSEWRELPARKRILEAEITALLDEIQRAE